MKKYLVSVAVRIASSLSVRAFTVPMDDDYNPNNDSPDIANSFPILRGAVYQRAKRVCTCRDEYDRYKPERTQVQAITFLCDVGVNEPFAERVETMMLNMDTDSAPENIIKILPESAKYYSDADLRSSIQSAIMQKKNW